jgi:hypothetical protein
LARDDADKAFSYATNARQAVGTASGFLAMVRDGCPVVYRPSSVAFLKPEGQGNQVTQRVHMLDANGVSVGDLQPAAANRQGMAHQGLRSGEKQGAHGVSVRPCLLYF